MNGAKLGEAKYIHQGGYHHVAGEATAITITISWGVNGVFSY